MKSIEIREAFLDFFKNKAHDIQSSAPMVVKDDPTLMFTNAGMNQFKDIFLGHGAIKNPRVANSQKCLRVSGKHNDLEEVGVDTYHHTMFEMLGNWSFGDYFKTDTIAWAWELLTEVYKLDKDRLYVTVFAGDAEDGLDKDQEAIDIWAKHCPRERILECDKTDNFWEMGDQGPCGPCSEIHIDLRSEEDRKAVDGATLVNQDHPQVIEIWNLVFMQFNRKSDRSLEPLPKQHVDTGMGFERLCMAMQGKTSNYDTDVFMPLIEKMEDISGLRYRPEASASKQQEDINIALRVVSDHVRAIAFSITDGQLPSNTGAGYVIRRILRRAVRYGYQTLNLKEPFLYRLVPILAHQMGGYFPEIQDQKLLVEKVIKEEEQSFFRTLAQGLKRIDQVCIELNAGSGGVVPGEVVFELYDTYGFPDDLTRLIAQGYGLEIDENGFREELNKQKDRSRQATTIEADDWVEVREDDIEEFVGYDHVETNVYLTKYRRVVVKGHERYQLVFNITPFYPEGGGQVGDKGYLEAPDCKVLILDTKKENKQIIHIAKDLPKNVNAKFRAVVDNGRRRLTTANHSATHLLHEALREVLGTHVEQKGSLVNADQLRFDFSHFQKVEPEELVAIERKVNDKVRANMALEEFKGVPIDEAKEMGAMALFGEKYGDLVRVIKFGTSVELCGGTHVQSTGDIGLFKIVTETAVAAGVRRIEAITSDKAFAFLESHVKLVDELSVLLKNPKNLIKTVQDLQDQNKQLQKEIEGYKRAKAGDLKGDLLKGARDVNGVQFIGAKVEMDAGSVKDLAFQLKKEVDNLFLIVGATDKGKATLTVAISDNLVAEKSWNAGQMIRDFAKHIQGGGGGQPFFATAGGKNPDGIEQALAEAEQLVAG